MKMGDYQELTALGDQKRMAIVLLATTLPILEDRAEIDPIITWFQEVAMECTSGTQRSNNESTGNPRCLQERTPMY